jgi:glutathione S-transferase
MSDLTAFLGERDFYYGDTPSLADVSVYGMLQVLHGGPMTGADQLIDDQPELIAYMKRMSERTFSGLEQPALDLPRP